MYATHCHDLFYITVKYHDYIPKGIQVTERTRKLQLKPSRGNNSESMTGRVVILVRDTSSWPVLQNCKVSSKYSELYSSYRADTKTFTDGRTDDGQMPGSSLYSPETFGRGIKIHFLNLFHSKAKETKFDLAIKQVKVNPGPWKYKYLTIHNRNNDKSPVNEDCIGEM